MPNDPLGSECYPHGALSLVRETDTNQTIVSFMLDAVQ